MKDWKSAAVNMLKTLAEIQNCKKNLNFYNIFSKVDHENYSPYDEGNVTYKNRFQNFSLTKNKITILF